MDILKIRSFSRWAKSERISDSQLKLAVEEMAQDLIDADLGAGIYKKRIAKKGYGRRGGYRTLLAFKRDEKAIFLFGFSKNEKENIENQQLVMLKKLAKESLNLSAQQVNSAIKRGYFIEVI